MRAVTHPSPSNKPAKYAAWVRVNLANYVSDQPETDFPVVLRIPCNRIGDHVRVYNEKLLTVVFHEILAALAPAIEFQPRAVPVDRENPQMVVRMHDPEHFIYVLTLKPRRPGGLNWLDKRLGHHVHRVGRIGKHALLVADYIGEIYIVPLGIPHALRSPARTGDGGINPHKT